MTAPLHSRQSPGPTGTRQPGRVRRVLFLMTGGLLIAVLLGCALLAVLVFGAGSLKGAIQLWAAFRPWMVSVQILCLGLAWHNWSALVNWLDRRRPMPAQSKRALIEWRNRLFLMLACAEALIVQQMQLRPM